MIELRVTPLSQSQAFGALDDCKVHDRTSPNWAGGALRSSSIVALMHWVTLDRLFSQSLTSML